MTSHADVRESGGDVEEERGRTYQFNQRVGESATTRSLAVFIDVILIAMITSLLTAPVLVSVVSERGSLAAFPLVWIAVFVVLQFAYNTLAEGLTGTTLGKRWGVWPVSLRVVRVDGTPVGFREAVVRAAFGLLEQSNLIGWIVGGVAIAASPTHQRLGDRAAGTLVVDGSKAETVTFDPGVVTFRMLDGRELQLLELTSGHVNTWLGTPQWLKIEGTDPSGAAVKLAFRMTRGATVFAGASEVQWLRTELERRFHTTFEERLETWRLALIGAMLLMFIASACGGFGLILLAESLIG